MNLLLLEPQQLRHDASAELSDRQRQHLRTVLRANHGDQLKIGVVNGKLGHATVHDRGTELELRDCHFLRDSPATLPITLILALPRPQMIKRILQTAACMGVQTIILLQTAKVEKSFWQSPSTSDAAIREQLILGLEQAGATQLPEVLKQPRFRPFAEDQLAAVVQGKTALIAHPGDYRPCPRLQSAEHAVLAIGPEGGFTEKELEWFSQTGFTAFQLGQRILKVEIAVPVILARLYP